MEWKSQTTGLLSPAKANCRSSRSLVVLTLGIILLWKLNLNINIKHPNDVGSPAAGLDGEVSTPVPLNISLAGGETTRET